MTGSEAPCVAACAHLQDAAAWLQVTQQQQQHSQQQQPTVQHPRHARVNLLKASLEQVLAQLQGSSGAGSCSSDKGGFDVHADELLPDLLVFPPGTDLHDHPLVTEGVLILQVRVLGLCTRVSMLVCCKSTSKM
jgi:hypothetical protein